MKINDNEYSMRTDITEFTTPDGCTEIGNCAFFKC